MDPILDYGEMTKDQKKDMNQDRKGYVETCKKFAKILSSGQWVKP